MTRRELLFNSALYPALSQPLAAKAAGRGPVAVVTSSILPAFNEAILHLRKSLERQGLDTLLLELVRGGPNPVESVIRTLKPPVTVVLGTAAVDFLSSHSLSVPVIASMVLDGHPRRSTSAGGPVATLTLRIPPAQIFSRIKSTFPPVCRIAVLSGPELPFSREELSKQAGKFHYAVQVVQCSTPKDVLDVLPSLRASADVVWCLPEPRLYPPGAVAPIMLSSIRNHLPLIGFSESFAQAGALAAFFPDYADIGAQTGDMVRSFLAGNETLRSEFPRKTRAVVNARIARVLGVEVANLPAEVIRL